MDQYDTELAIHQRSDAQVYRTRNLRAEDIGRETNARPTRLILKLFNDIVSIK